MNTRLSLCIAIIIAPVASAGGLFLIHLAGQIPSEPPFYADPAYEGTEHIKLAPLDFLTGSELEEKGYSVAPQSYDPIPSK